MRKIRSFIFLGISLMLINSTSPEVQPVKEKKYLPKELKKIRFGMSFAELMKVRKNKPTDKSQETYDFRKVYSETINRNGIESVAYYFDNEGALPLYEIIIIYDSEKARDKAAKSLLGAPNYKGKEWKIDAGIDYPLHAWSFKNKLVYAIPLTGSEWEDELE